MNEVVWWKWHTEPLHYLQDDGVDGGDCVSLKVYVESSDEQSNGGVTLS